MRFAEAIAAITRDDLDAMASAMRSEPALVDRADDRGQSLLHFTAAEGNRRAAACLLEAGAELNAVDADGTTPLHWAASLGRTAMVSLLLDAGADPTREGGEGRGGTPLMYALFYGRRSTARRLALRGRHPDNLRVAAGLGLTERVRALTPSGRPSAEARARRTWYRPHAESPPCSVGDGDQEVLDDALVYAATHRRHETARALLDLGADPSARPHYCTSLHAAAFSGDREVVELLLSRGVDVALRDQAYGASAGDWAAWGGAEDLAEMLHMAEAEHDVRVAARRGARSHVAAWLTANPTDSRSSEALALALEHGQHETAAMLRAHGVALDLAAAAGLGLAEEVEVLLAQGVDPASTRPVRVPTAGQRVRTVPLGALLAAARGGHLQIARRLRHAGAPADVWTSAALGETTEVLAALAAGHQLEARDPFGRTVLHRAIEGGHPHTVHALLQRGASVDTTADGFSHGLKAIHLAAAHGADAALLGLLEAAGANTHEIVNDGTPLDVALRHHKPRTADLLRARGVGRAYR